MRKKFNRKHWIFWFVVLVVAILFIRYVPTNLIKPGEKSFSLTASDVPETMKVGESFTIEAELNFSLFRSFVATTGDRAVYIEFSHPDDPDIMYTDIANVQYFPAGGSDSRSETFTPDKPGVYTLSVSAHFRIGQRSYSIALPDQTVIVTE